MQLFDHVLKWKKNLYFLGGDNTVKWIAYIKLKPTHNVTLPGVRVTASVWKGWM